MNKDLIDKILALKDLGYTKDEIVKITEFDKAEVVQKKEQVYNVDEGTNDVETSQDVETTNNNEGGLSLSDQLEEVKNKILTDFKNDVSSYVQSVKKDIQEANVIISAMSEQDETHQDITDILGKIINPPSQNNGGKK